MVDYEGNLYLFGGINTKGEFLNTLHIFYLDIPIWEKITPSSEFAPLERSGMAMFKHSEGILITGGLSLNGRLGDMWLYNII